LLGLASSIGVWLKALSTRRRSEGVAESQYRRLLAAQATLKREIQMRFVEMALNRLEAGRSPDTQLTLAAIREALTIGEAGFSPDEVDELSEQFIRLRQLEQNRKRLLTAQD